MDIVSLPEGSRPRGRDEWSGRYDLLMGGMQGSAEAVRDSVQALASEQFDASIS